MLLALHPVVPLHSTTGYPLGAPAGANDRGTDNLNLIEVNGYAQCRWRHGRNLRHDMPTHLLPVLI